MIKTFFIAVFAVLVTTSSYGQSMPNGLAVNQKAPLFTAKDQNGSEFNLKKALKKGSVVMVFYRGQWCPYCNKQLSQLEDSLQQIINKGASLIAISPEKSENIVKTIGKTKATYPILHDEGLKIMNLYNVAFKVDDNTIEKYKKYGLDFEQANGSNGTNLPVPAVYIIDKDGKIKFRYFDTDYKKRVSVATILANL